MKLVLHADKDKTLEFIKVPELFTFLIIFVFLFIIFYPWSLFKQVLAYEEPQAVTLEYLQNLLEQYPNSSELTMAIINQEIGMDRLDQAESQINELIKSGKVNQDMNWNIVWLQYQLQFKKAYQFPRSEEDRKKRFENLAKTIKALGNATTDEKRLFRLSDDAVQIGHPEIAVELYKRLYKLGYLANKPQKLADAGKAALQVMNYQDASNFYFLAMKASEKNSEQEKIYAMEGLKTLQSGNLLDQALSAAEGLPKNLLQDQDVLIYLTKLSLAANKPILAQKYVEKALNAPLQKGVTKE